MSDLQTEYVNLQLRIAVEEHLRATRGSQTLNQTSKESV